MKRPISSAPENSIQSLKSLQHRDTTLPDRPFIIHSTPSFSPIDDLRSVTVCSTALDPFPIPFLYHERHLHSSCTARIGLLGQVAGSLAADVSAFRYIEKLVFRGWPGIQLTLRPACPPLID